MKIRKIKPEEISFLQEMLYEAIFVEKGQEKLPQSIIKEPSLWSYIDRFGNQHLDLCFVVEKEEKLVGAVWGRLFPKEQKGYGYVNDEIPELSIAIKEEERGKQWGTKLMNSIMEEYNMLGVEALSLSVDKKNKAFQLYQKLGFKIHSETDKSVTMKKIL